LVVLGIFIASSVKKETDIFQKEVNLLLKVTVTDLFDDSPPRLSHYGFRRFPLLPALLGFLHEI
jgi:hypothetical protein